MHRLLRNLHLWIGLAITPYLLMYGISALQMAHPNWIEVTHETTLSTREIELSQGVPAQIARTAQSRLELRGSMSRVRETAEGLEFRVSRPGSQSDVQIDPATGRANIETRRSDLGGFLNQVHVLSGWHEHMPSGLLALALLGVSMAMLFLGVTGVYLWFKLLAERRLGWIVLAVGAAYSLTLVVAIRSL